jgi:hypothetical protein
LYVDDQIRNAALLNGAATIHCSYTISRPEDLAVEGVAKSILKIDLATDRACGSLTFQTRGLDRCRDANVHGEEIRSISHGRFWNFL